MRNCGRGVNRQEKNACAASISAGIWYVRRLQQNPQERKNRRRKRKSLCEMLTWYRTIWGRFALHTLDVSAFTGGKYFFFMCAFRNALRTAFAVRRQAAGSCGRLPHEKRSIASFLNRASHGSSRRPVRAKEPLSEPYGSLYNQRTRLLTVFVGRGSSFEILNFSFATAIPNFVFRIPNFSDRVSRGQKLQHLRIERFGFFCCNKMVALKQNQLCMR